MRYGGVSFSQRFYIPRKGEQCPPGKRQTVEFGGMTVEAASSKLKIKTGKIEEGKPIGGDEILMSELFQGVLDYAETKCRRSTCAAYNDIIKKHLSPFFGGIKAVHLHSNEAIITKFIAQKLNEPIIRRKKKPTENSENAKHYSKATINSMLTVLQLALSLASNRTREAVWKHHEAVMKYKRNTIANQA